MVKKSVRKGIDDHLVDGFAYVFMGISALVCLLPLVSLVSISLTPMTELVKAGGFSLVPTTIDFTAYQLVLSDRVLPQGFAVSTFLVIVGTSLNLTITALMAYPLSVARLPGKRVIMLFLVFTMMFSGGMIPTFLVIKATGLMDTVWSMIIPGLAYASYIIIMRLFFEQLPEELYEAARIDGAGEFRIFFQVVLPLSLPVLVTVGLFYGIGHWNQYFDAILYVTDPTLKPLQLIIRQMIQDANRADANIELVVPSMSLRMAAAVLAVIPVLIVYPFLQRYFVRGLLVGAVKG